jgi:hypothetical protein
LKSSKVKTKLKPKGRDPKLADRMTELGILEVRSKTESTDKAPVNKKMIFMEKNGKLI